MPTLEEVIDKGKTLGKLALYFGVWDQPGHYWHDTRGHHLWDNLPTDLPSMWRTLADGGLLRNGKREDVYNGRVWWTCGGASAFWYAFYWWDRSADRRGACNSGLYVRGFGWPESNEAFAYGCATFPHVVARQKFPLVIQEH
jgi:hypothetical protein